MHMLVAGHQTRSGGAPCAEINKHDNVDKHVPTLSEVLLLLDSQQMRSRYKHVYKENGNARRPLTSPQES